MSDTAKLSNQTETQEWWKAGIEAVEPAADATRRPSPPPHPRRILVADDESLAAAAVVVALRQLGYTPIGPARDGEHAIELCFSSRPDLALLDARMATEADGIDAARAMFTELLIPVVIISAYSDKQQVENASAAGIFGYLVKPVTKEQLRPAIEVAWARFNQYIARDIEAELLSRHIQDLRDIDRAKWMLVERDDLEEGDAMRSLRRLAKIAGRPVAEIAREILRQR